MPLEAMNALSGRKDAAVVGLATASSAAINYFDTFNDYVNLAAGIAALVYVVVKIRQSLVETRIINEREEERKEGNKCESEQD